MPRIQVKKSVQQGLLSGNGVDCKCRVEISTQFIEGNPTDRTLDIWVQKAPPEGAYRLLMDSEAVSMRFSRGLWREVPD
jgi:hypothetical protein